MTRFEQPSARRRTFRVAVGPDAAELADRRDVLLMFDLVRAEIYARALTFSATDLGPVGISYELVADDTSVAPTLIAALAQGHLARALADLERRLPGDGTPTFAPTFRAPARPARPGSAGSWPDPERIR